MPAIFRLKRKGCLWLLMSRFNPLMSFPHYCAPQSIDAVQHQPMFARKRFRAMASCRISPSFQTCSGPNHGANSFFCIIQMFGVPCLHNCYSHPCNSFEDGVGREERTSLTTAFFTRPALLLHRPVIRLPRVVPHLPPARSESCQPLVLLFASCSPAAFALRLLHKDPKLDLDDPPWIFTISVCGILDQPMQSWGLFLQVCCIMSPTFNLQT